MDNPLATFYRWQVSSGALDGWTSYHLAAGLFIAKVAQWLGCSDLWAVLWVLIIGIAWEIFERLVFTQFSPEEEKENIGQPSLLV